MYKGSLDTIILKLLTDHPEMYGYEIAKKIDEITNQRFSIKEGSLYPALHRLEAKELLTSVTKPYNNRMRKYYRISPKGARESTRLITEIRQFIDQMRLIINA